MERRFEALIWKFWLITLVPLVMSLLGSISCFAIGTYAELSVLRKGRRAASRTAADC